MKFRVIMFLLACGHAHLLSAQEFPLLGKLPDLGREWVLQGHGAHPEKEAPTKKGAYEWSWATFANARTGDIISFAADRYLNLNRSVADESVHQSACDMFPGGLPRFMFSGLPGWAVADTIRFSVITIAKAEALEYSFVYESGTDSAPNRLGHGYALAFGDTIIFVQHTSEDVITTEDAKGMAASLLHSHPSSGPKQ